MAQPTVREFRPVEAAAFVGREAEIAAVLSVLESPPVLVLIEGEAGIGKTRFVRELPAVRRGPIDAGLSAAAAGSGSHFRSPRCLRSYTGCG